MFIFFKRDIFWFHTAENEPITIWWFTLRYISDTSLQVFVLIVEVPRSRKKIRGPKYVAELKTKQEESKATQEERQRKRNREGEFQKEGLQSMHVFAFECQAYKG